MKISTGFGWPLRGIPDQVRQAEEAGYDAVVTAETQHDSMMALAIAAEHTTSVEVCTAVTIAFPRSPMVLAMECWDLQALSGGRVNIGLGSQVKGHNLRRFAGSWSPPAPRMRDYIKSMRAIWDCWQNGTKLNYISENYTVTLMTPFFNPGPIDAPMPKISMSAVNPVMAQVAGEVSDGLLPHGFTTEKYLKNVLLPAVHKGVRKAGRSMDEIEISAGGMWVIGENQAEIEQGLERLRQPISFYGSTRSYHGVFRAHDREELGLKLHEMSLKGMWNEMRASIPEEVLHDFAITATWDTLPQVLRDRFSYASRISLRPPMHTPEQRERAKWLFDEIHKIPAPAWEQATAQG